MWIIDEILMLLKDGNWHDLSQIAKKSSSNERRSKMIVTFLSKYDFIELDRKKGKAKLRPLTLDFINKMQRIRIEETIEP